MREFADILENAPDFNAALHRLVVDTIKKHKRIIFNGNNYCKEWTAEAEKRGLLNLKNTAEALPYFTAPKISNSSAAWACLPSGKRHPDRRSCRKITARSSISNASPCWTWRKRTSIPPSPPI